MVRAFGRLGACLCSSVLFVLDIGAVLRLVIRFQEGVSICLHTHRDGHATSSLVAHVLSVAPIVLRVRHLMSALPRLTLSLLHGFAHVLGPAQVYVLRVKLVLHQFMRTLVVRRSRLPMKVVRIGKGLLSGQYLFDTLIPCCKINAVINLGEFVFLPLRRQPPIVL